MTHADPAARILRALQQLSPSLAIDWTLEKLAELGLPADDDGRELVALAEAWLDSPREETRLKALAESEQRNCQDWTGWLAAAVAWSGGSMVDPRVSQVDPPPGLSAKAAAAALLDALGGCEQTTPAVWERMASESEALALQRGSARTAQDSGDL